jgi:hypothetical protein
MGSSEEVQKLLPKQVLYQAELCPDVNDYRQLLSAQARPFYIVHGKFACPRLQAFVSGRQRAPL